MTRRTWLSILTATVLLPFFTLAAVKPGDPAPNFQAKDIFGKVHRLSDYKGKIIVLEAFNLGCPFCRNHYKTGAMQELQKQFRAKGVVWLLIDSVHKGHPDYVTPKEAQKLWKKYKIQATAWLKDTDGTIGHAYGLRTTPHMIVIDKNGKVVYTGAIDDRPSARGDPRKAHNYVKEVVEALLKGKPAPIHQTRPYGCSVKYAKK